MSSASAGLDRPLGQPLEAVVEAAEEHLRAVAVGRGVGPLDVEQQVAHGLRVEGGVVDPLDEVVDGALEEDVVLPERVVGVEDQVLAFGRHGSSAALSTARRAGPRPGFALLIAASPADHRAETRRPYRARTWTTRAADQAFLRVSRRFWHVIARSDDVVPGGLVPVTLLDEQLVLGRTVDGELLLLDDLCAHRGVRLSMGDLLPTGCVRCPYHGWEYDLEGRCTAIPQLDHDRIPATARVASYRVAEQAGMVWACLVGADEEAGPDAGPPRGRRRRHGSVRRRTTRLGVPDASARSRTSATSPTSRSSTPTPSATAANR